MQFIGGLGRHDDHAARRLHRRTVLHQRGNRRGRHQHAGQAAAVAELQGNLLAGGHRHRACLGDHDAVVAHLRRQQGDIATQGGIQAAIVDDAAGGAIAREGIAAGHEVGRGDGMRGGHQAAHVDGRGGAEIHAIRVAQEHLAIGRDAAEDLAGLAVLHPVQRHGTTVRLLEIDLCLRPHIEGLPVDRAALGGLVDRHLAAALGDRRRAADHLAAGRQLVGDRRPGPGEGRQAQPRKQRGHEGATTAALAASAHVFGDGDPDALFFTPDQAIEAVDGGVSVHVDSL